MPSNQERPVEAQYAKLGSIFHNEGNAHYNAQDAHWLAGLRRHARFLYRDQTDGDNVDNGFAYAFSFPHKIDMPRFYTKKGDDGYTGLLGKGRAPKYDPRIEAVGVIDEANASIALARTLSKASETSSILRQVQQDLYHIMSEVASTPENASRFQILTADRVTWLETQTDELSSRVNIPEEFILPGDSLSGAAIDLARTIVRRAERHIAHLLHLKKLENPQLLRYMNRLSSLCFVLELLENQAAGVNHSTLAKE
jgi:cob(I)alamin adenosyltransferase